LGWKFIFQPIFTQKHVINTKNKNQLIKKNQNRTRSPFPSMFIEKKKSPPSNSPRRIKHIDTKNDRFHHWKVQKLMTFSLVASFKQLSYSSL
jgi:hypothetical protein